MMACRHWWEFKISRKKHEKVCIFIEEIFMTLLSRNK